jgi:methenyltetrahydrofolate cyclohydrolase
MSLVDRTLAEVLDRFGARDPAPGGGSAAALTGALAAALTEMSAAFALAPTRSGHAGSDTGADLAHAADAAVRPKSMPGAGVAFAADGDAAVGPEFVPGAGLACAADGDAAVGRESVLEPESVPGANPESEIADQHARWVKVRNRAHDLRGELLSLAEDDTRSYAPVLDALAIERSDPDRPARLRAALAAAADIPLAIAVAAAEVGELALAAAQGGNAHLLGDATAGAVIAEAAARSAARLVELNLAASPQDARLGAAETAAQRAWAARMAVLAAATPNVASAGEPPSP